MSHIIIYACSMYLHCISHVGQSIAGVIYVKGRIVHSPVTGRYEPFYPAWKRNLFCYLVSVPVIGVCLSGVFASLWGILELQSWVNVHVKTGSVPFFCSYLPKVLLAISISVLDDVYKRIAVWLNDRGTFAFIHFVFLVYFLRFVLCCQYHCKWLPEKTRLSSSSYRLHCMPSHLIASSPPRCRVVRPPGNLDRGQSFTI